MMFAGGGGGRMGIHFLGVITGHRLWVTQGVRIRNITKLTNPFQNHFLVCMDKLLFENYSKYKIQNIKYILTFPVFYFTVIYN